MLVEIVSDLVCPWCYIGKRHLESALAMLAAEGVSTSFDLRLRAFQLDPTAPLGSPRPVREAYAHRFGGEEAADRILDRVTQAAAATGLGFAMDKAQRANTGRAHRLLKLVQEVEPRLQMAVNESVMCAYFTEGRDISDVTTLDDCANRAGFRSPKLPALLVTDDPSDRLARAVESDLAWARERGIHSVPTLVINDGLEIPGAQEPMTLVRLLRKLAVAN